MCIAGGICFRAEDAKSLKEKGLILVGLTLSDPDVQNSMIEHVGQFFLHGTNSQLALERYHKEGLDNTVLFPFGVDRGYASANTTAAPELSADVICMGHAYGRPERVDAMTMVSRSINNVRLYGNGWNTPGSESVTGVRQIQAMREGKIHINFPRTRAGFVNVKCGVFESIANGGVLCTERFDEIENYFTYDSEIIGYRDIDDLIGQLNELLKQPYRLESIKRAAFARLVKEHLYEHRWLSFLDEIKLRLNNARSMAASMASKTKLLGDVDRGISCKKRILVIGYYGAKNIGDELILRSINQNFTSKDSPYKIIVAAENPVAVTQEHALPAFSRRDINRAQAEVASATSVILGGGGLWNDYTFARAGGITGLFSDNSISITGYSKLLLLACNFKRPFHVFGLGVGPLEDPDAKRYLRFLSDQADSITVRDDASRELLETIDGWTKTVNVAPDPVYALDISNAEAPQHVQDFSANRQVLGINLRPWINHDEEAFIERVSAVLINVCEQKNIALLGLPFRHPYDSHVLKQVFEKLPRSIPCLLLEPEGPNAIDQIIGSLKYCTLVFAMRLHTCILAHRMGTPVVGLSYDPKVSASFKQVKVPELALPLDAREPAITTTLLDTFGNLEKYKNRTIQVVHDLEKKARKGFEDLRCRLDEAPLVKTPLVVSYIQQITASLGKAQTQTTPKYYFEQINDDLIFDSDIWVIPQKPSPKWSCEITGTKSLNIIFEFDKGKHSYIYQDPISFDNPPSHRPTARILANTNFCLTFQCNGTTPNVNIWVIEYSDTIRLKHTNQQLKDGKNILDFKTHPRTRLFRLAIRFSGRGQIEIGDIQLFRGD